VRDDDEILEAYEQELTREDVRPRSNRGFWLVLGAMVLAGIVLVGEIIVNRPVKESIGHAQATLRDAEAGAQRVEASTGSFLNADARGLAVAEPSLTYVGPDEPSSGPDEVSVAAMVGEWGGATQVRPGVCFYLHVLEGETYYGVGTGCTGRDALEATDPRW
jgi:hypothetical protein